MLELRKKNEEIAEKFQDIEDKLSAAADIAELFEQWMLGMKGAFGIPFLWISIVDSAEGSPLIQAIKASPVLAKQLNVIAVSTFMELIPHNTAPVLVNSELRPFFRLLPQNKYFVRSMAVAPITLKECIIGSLNHGDSSPSRYEPSMDTSLLHSLAARLSARLSEIVA